MNVVPWLCALALLPRLALAQEESLDPERLEIGVLPAVNYDSDLGLGLGSVLVLARFDPDYAPYRWRLEALVLFALKEVDGAIEVPFQNHYLNLDLPGLAGGVLRLNIFGAFRRLSTSGWYGLGSESQQQPNSQFLRTFPSLRGVARLALLDEKVPVGKRKLEVFGGAELSRSWMTLYPGSVLEKDAARAEAPVTDSDRVLADLVHGTRDHWQLLLLAGLIWDTRDHETVPSDGAFYELSMRVSPAVDAGLGYVGFTLSPSWFWPLFGPRLVLAARIVGDVMIGDPPVYALSTFGGLAPINGPGGSNSTRGVLLDRFHGKIKLLGNLEIRARILPFEIFEERFELGAAAFTDAGRVWADFENHTVDGRTLDRPFSHFQVGVGGGLRLRWGETFIIRAELGYSPTDGTNSLYIDINQAF